jgi:excisionase family DNA binding protein
MLSDKQLAYSVEDFADVLAIGRTKAWQLVRKGDIPVRRIGRRTVILREDIIKYVESLPVEIGGEAA